MYHHLRTKPGHYDEPTAGEITRAVHLFDTPEHINELMHFYGELAHYDAMDGLFNLASRNMAIRSQLEVRLEAQVAAPH